MHQSFGGKPIPGMNFCRLTNHVMRYKKSKHSISSFFFQSSGGLVKVKFKLTTLRGGFRTAVPFWGQTIHISSSLSPKRDWGPKGVKRPFRYYYYYCRNFTSLKSPNLVRLKSPQDTERVGKKLEKQGRDPPAPLSPLYSSSMV